MRFSFDGPGDQFPTSTKIGACLVLIVLMGMYCPPNAFWAFALLSMVCLTLLWGTRR